ncbi:extracellular solute-binding protein [Streptomyces sp. RKND-216]|uniref:ABC transporter substrate-binding protein n=1 Tax=Streptomyces sp. RKND-216 TaxID=2562581 RepID=UPI00109D8FD7|nr:extracellular solute-binding protein [Streptomyces sp. RKND-216]THA26529.1 extracellular solute-binding protein [Streptomyces sp. RKND-216]
MRIRTRGLRTTAAALALTLGTGLLAGCGDTASAKPDNQITVWSLENLPPRMAVGREVVARFEKKTGVEVKLVGVDESKLPQLIMSAAAAGNLPDVIGAAPLGQIWQMYGNELLDTNLTGEIVDDLGSRTFNDNALGLASDDGTRLAVPSDSWQQILVYRKDMLERAGLPVPDSYADLRRAAKALDEGPGTGISLATDPSDLFTQQSFESFALANDCRLVESDDVALESPACRSAFAAYDELASEYGADGVQTVDTTRATYFAGRSPIIMWSSFLLDELAGLRKDALPSCPACRKDPGHLAENSGVVTALEGPDGAEPAQFGEISSWAVTRTAEKEASGKFVRFMLTEGYEEWFGMAPEGKIPVREGTASDPDRFQQAWRASEIGVDSKKPLEEVYPSELLDRMSEGVGNMRRWGITQGEGLLVGATNGELPVPQAIGAMASDQIPPREAARQADEEVTALRESLQ